MTHTNIDQEIREARQAGIRALNSLRQAQRHMDSARSWGIFDMLGGGMISSLIKHSKLDDAQRCVEQAQDDLRDFCRELEDVDMPDVRIDDLLTFADFFFDGFLADFLVQQRINEARARLEQICRQVEEILYRLGERL
ncbi:MAG: hypothetical protein IJ124_01370 [Clostridia bacterium]|nr:hypothetical protein [Clostridia bacterium]